MKGVAGQKVMMALALLGVVATQVHAQKPVGSDGVWTTFGFGASEHPTHVLLSGSYAFARGRTAYQAAVDYGAPFWSTGRYLVTVSGGVGRRSYSPYHLLAQFVGPSVIYRVERDEIYGAEGGYEEKIRRTVAPGLGANAQFYLKPLGPILPEVGVGMELFGNLNAVRSFYGIRFSVLFHNTI